MLFRSSYIVNLFENRFSAEQLRNAAVQIIGKPIEGMSEIVQQVGKKRKTALLSNTNPLHYDYSIDTIPALNAIPSERHFVSFKLGILKPNMGIFRKVIELTNVTAGQIFFVDDSPENVSGAQGVGIRASQLKGVDDLKRELIELGVI